MSTQPNTEIGGGNGGGDSCDNHGYCVKCKQTRDMTETNTTTSKTGRSMLKGVCPICKTKMSRFLPNPAGTKNKVVPPRKTKMDESVGGENPTEEPRSPEEEKEVPQEPVPVEEPTTGGGKKKKIVKKPVEKKKASTRKKKSQEDA